MDEYNKILTLTDSEDVQLSQSFKDLLHTHLVLGQTRWVCRHGTLSEGHDKITPSHRYYQAIKEMWYIGQSMQNLKANAKLYRADILDAEEKLADPDIKESDKLRAEAKKLQAETNLVDALIGVEDKTRMLDEYNKVRLELKDEVEARYPQGIEQAEPDNWKALLDYRMLRGVNPNNHERVENIPLPPEEKLLASQQWGRYDAAAAMLAGSGKTDFKSLEGLKNTIKNIAVTTQNKRLIDARKKGK